MDMLQLILAGAAGVVIGLTLAWYVGPAARRARRLQCEIDRLHAEYQGYRGEVTRHFERTGELVNALTRSYKAVYDHLARGAQSFTSTGIVTTRVQFAGEDLPVLETAGARAGGASPLAAAARAASSPAPSVTPGDVAPAPPRDYAPEEKNDAAVRTGAPGTDSTVLAH